MQEPPPLSHWISLGRMPKGGKSVELTADPRLREAVAEAINVPSIELLEVTSRIKERGAQSYQLDGTFSVELTQTCVVSLEPIEASLEIEFTRTFIPETEHAKPDTTETEIIIDYESEDEPEIFTGNRIDLLAVVIEELVLALDPFPRAPSAVLETASNAESEPDLDTRKPFAGLKSLISEKNNGDGE